MAFAASSIRLTASGVEMSGLGSPLRTATTTATVASGVSLLATTLPESSTSLYGGCTTGTSNGSPRTTCWWVAPPAPIVAFTLWPVLRSKAGVILSIGHLMPPGATRVTSSARALYELHRVKTTTADESKYLIARLLLQWAGYSIRRIESLRFPTDAGWHCCIDRRLAPTASLGTCHAISSPRHERGFVIKTLREFHMARIRNTYLDVFPLCLGGNVFGWTANEQQSFDVLDAYAAAGGNFIDTADVYSAWVHTRHPQPDGDRHEGRHAPGA